MVQTSRERRSDLQDSSYTDFIWEFSQKGLQALIWLLNSIDSIPLFLEKLICKTAFSSVFDYHLQCINFIRVTTDWQQCLLCAAPSHGGAEKKKTLITTELCSLLFKYVLHQANCFSSAQGKSKFSRHDQSPQPRALLVTDGLWAFRLPHRCKLINVK